MKNPLRLGVVTTAAALTLALPTTPAQAIMGSGTNGCEVSGAFKSEWTLGPPHSIRACIAADNAIQATGQVMNTSSSSNYSVTTRLHRSSDGGVIAYHNCQAIVPASETYFCTKSWPKSNTMVYTSVSVQRGSVTSATVYSSHMIITA